MVPGLDFETGEDAILGGYVFALMVRIATILAIMFEKLHTKCYDDDQICVY